LKGYIGWLAWLFVHILNLIGFRNRLVVLVQWAWSYFSYQRAIRLITGPLPDSESGFPPDQPPLKLRRSAEASAKAEGARR
jgi:NADH:ubiquinone reductase (H+-translocating)